jgi:hypothetical protein
MSAEYKERTPNLSTEKFHFSENELFKILVANYIEETFTDKNINMKSESHAKENKPRIWKINHKT